MYLRSIEMKGFKSFPERARLEFSPGVSVIVGPNGSGKSNITDAVLWALGEQSPGAIRGASMQDVISGQVQLMFDNTNTAWPQVQAGTVRAIGVSTPNRLKIAPELPRDHLLVMNMCGRGDKDIFTVADALGAAL